MLRTRGERVGMPSDDPQETFGIFGRVPVFAICSFVVLFHILRIWFHAGLKIAAGPVAGKHAR